MPSTLIQTILAGLIRTAIAMAGGYLVAHGALSSTDVAALSPQLQELLGSGVTLAVAGWSAYAHHQADVATAAKEVVAVQLATTTANRAGIPVAPAAIIQAATIITAAKLQTTSDKTTAATAAKSDVVDTKAAVADQKAKS